MNISTISSVTINSGSKIGTIYHKSAFRIGKIMVFSVICTTSTTVSYADTLFSGFPKPKVDKGGFSFVGNSFSPSFTVGFHVDTDGNLNPDAGSFAGSSALTLACTYIIDEE